MNVIDKARRLAHEAHDAVGQRRKYTYEPYWVHTDAVAVIVARTLPNDAEAIAATHLHDIIEDVFPHVSKYDLYFIANEFGDRVATLVNSLTDVYTREAWPDLNRAKRKALERERLGHVDNVAKTIKLADLIDNTASIVRHDPDFAKVYLREKNELLPYLFGGDMGLWTQAAAQCIAGSIALGVKF